MTFLLKTKNLLLVAILGICLMLWSLIGSSPVSAPAPAVVAKDLGAINISGLAYSNYVGECLVSQLEAETLAVAPRRMGAFRIKSVNELVLRKVTFLLELDAPPELASDENSNQPDQFSLGLKNLVDIKGMGRVTQVVVDGLRLDLRKSGVTHLDVIAKAGVFDLKKKELRMDEALFKGPLGKTLVSSQVFWDEADRVFRIPGSYLMTDNARETHGEGALLDTDFKVMPLQTKNKD